MNKTEFWRDAFAHDTVKSVIYSFCSTYLETLPLNKAISTRELNDKLWPEADARGNDILLRNKMCDIVLSLATVKPSPPGLANYCSRGAWVRMYGRRVQRWIWHPRAAEPHWEAHEERKRLCPHCGGEL